MDFMLLLSIYQSFHLWKKNYIVSNTSRRRCTGRLLLRYPYIPTVATTVGRRYTPGLHSAKNAVLRMELFV